MNDTPGTLHLGQASTPQGLVHVIAESQEGGPGLDAQLLSEPVQAILLRPVPDHLEPERRLFLLGHA